MQERAMHPSGTEPSTVPENPPAEPTARESASSDQSLSSADSHPRPNESHPSHASLGGLLSLIGNRGSDSLLLLVLLLILADEKVDPALLMAILYLLL